MLQEIKELQSNAVSKIVSLVDRQDDITFKSPTGSGKTYMMADFMNRVLSNTSIVFIVSSLSKANLAGQNYEKFLQFNYRFTNLNPYLINSEYAEDEKIYIPEDFNIYVLPRDLYKEKARIKTSGALINLLMTLKFMGKEIYLIKDECHVATNNLDELNEFFSKIINMSATPKFKPDVEITNTEAENAKLIKRLAPNVLSKQKEDLYSVYPDATVEDAVNKFIQIKDKYVNKLKVNPCLIIQISNKDKAEEEWRKIKSIINDPNKNLKWMYIVNKNGTSDATSGSDTNDQVKKLPISKWKDYVKGNDSLIDIIVFKMVITEGWDIPRACMLYQVRDSQSKQMDEQVIGRVRRNPILLNWEEYDEEAHKLALTSWVWGIVDNKLRNFKNVSLVDKKNVRVKTTKLASIEKNNDFDVKEYIKTKGEFVNTSSIFDLYKKWNKISIDTEKMCWDNIHNCDDWINYSNFIEDIESKNNAFMEDYEKSMELDEIASFPQTSYFEITNNMTEIDDWSWKLNSSEDNEYYFDSEAEKEFAKILKKLGAEIWGKNFYPNSSIKFEYILNSKHSSYPDFILKDKKNKIHIFEVKSVNVGLNPNIDAENYLEKVEALRKMYLAASNITLQYFYIPVKSNDDWIIYKSYKGEEEVMNKSQFIEFIKTNL